MARLALALLTVGAIACRAPARHPGRVTTVHVPDVQLGADVRNEPDARWIAGVLAQRLRKAIDAAPDLRLVGDDAAPQPQVVLRVSLLYAKLDGHRDPGVTDAYLLFPRVTTRGVVWVDYAGSEDRGSFILMPQRTWTWMRCEGAEYDAHGKFVRFADDGFTMFGEGPISKGPDFEPWVIYEETPVELASDEMAVHILHELRRLVRAP
jgi:hypothetical protein